MITQAHGLENQSAVFETINRRKPAHRYSFAKRLLKLFTVGGHALAVSPIDNDGVGRPEAPGGTRGVERRVAAAVDGNPPTEQRRITRGHLMEERHRVDDLGRVPGGNVDSPANLGTDRQKDRVELTRATFGFDVVHHVSYHDLNSDTHNARYFGVERGARESVGGDAIAHHAAELFGRIDETDLVAETAKMVRRAESRGTGAHDENPFAGIQGGRRQCPAVLDREVTEEPFDRVDADRVIYLHPVARGLTRMKTDSAHD